MHPCERQEVQPEKLVKWRGFSAVDTPSQDALVVWGRWWLLLAFAARQRNRCRWGSSRRLWCLGRHRICFGEQESAEEEDLLSIKEKEYSQEHEATPEHLAMEGRGKKTHETGAEWKRGLSRAEGGGGGKYCCGSGAEACERLVGGLSQRTGGTAATQEVTSGVQGAHQDILQDSGACSLHDTTNPMLCFYWDTQNCFPPNSVVFGPGSLYPPDTEMSACILVLGLRCLCVISIPEKWVLHGQILLCIFRGWT